MDPQAETWVMDIMHRYRQPQFEDAIYAWVNQHVQPPFRELAEGRTAAETVRAAMEWTVSTAGLEQMVADGKLKHVDGGVDRQGRPRVMYALPDFEDGGGSDAEEG